MGEKKVVNLSRFLLFEQAGDSETDFLGNMMLDYDQDHASEAMEDDDAESCSSDVGCYGKYREAQIGILKQVSTETHIDEDDDVDDGGMRSNIHAIGSYHHHHHHHKLRGFEQEEEEEEDEDDDDDGMISEVTSTANSHSLRKCVQSRNQNMSEMEKSRLFWDTCLAS